MIIGRVQWAGCRQLSTEGASDLGDNLLDKLAGLTCSVPVAVQVDAVVLVVLVVRVSVP